MQVRFENYTLAHGCLRLRGDVIKSPSLAGLVLSLAPRSSSTVGIGIATCHHGAPSPLVLFSTLQYSRQAVSPRPLPFFARSSSTLPPSTTTVLDFVIQTLPAGSSHLVSDWIVGNFDLCSTLHP